eukprot:GHVR01105712.1.p2 GENE.GHVR01105712.1~~GHVR01105712.1.p2  ORF type:complete len:189 (-),score=12.83 GHVR01105712.1:659-1225(-)
MELPFLTQLYEFVEEKNISQHFHDNEHVEYEELGTLLENIKAKNPDGNMNSEAQAGSTQSVNPNAIASSSVSKLHLESNEIDRSIEFIQTKFFEETVPTQGKDPWLGRAPTEAKFQCLVDELLHHLTSILNEYLSKDHKEYTMEYLPNKEYEEQVFVFTKGSKPDCRWKFKRGNNKVGELCFSSAWLS